jgi:hypothetical protein
MYPSERLQNQSVNQRSRDLRSYTLKRERGILYAAELAARRARDSALSELRNPLVDVHPQAADTEPVEPSNIL